MWNSILGTEKDESVELIAKSKLALLVEPKNYVHIKTAKTAKEAWDNLRSAYEDKGLSRKVALLKTLLTTTLEKSDSVEEF